VVFLANFAQKAAKIHRIISPTYFRSLIMIGLHLDLKWTMYRREFFQKIVRYVHELGMDTILLEFENKIFIERFRPAIHPDAWSAEDLKWFLRLCHKYGITVIPKIPLLGHMEWILQWPWWAHLQEHFDRREICPSHPETPGFVARLLEHILTLFPDAPFIHLGGDETFSLGTCSRCHDSGKPKSELYMDHYFPLFNQVRAAGKRPMIYGDMILAHPEIITKLPRTVIICDWDYSSGAFPGRTVWGYNPVGSPDELKKLPPPLKRFRKYFIDRDGTLTTFPYSLFLKKEGFEVVLMPSARCLGDHYCAPRTWLHVRNAHAAGRKAADLNLTGMIITSWAIRFNHLQTNWPAIAAGAWSYFEPQTQLSQLSERFARQFWGLDCPEVFDILDLLSPELPDLHAGTADPYPPNIVHKYIQHLYKDTESKACKFVEQKLAEVRKSYTSGWRQLHRLKNKIRRNRDIYEHWLLAATTLKHKAQTTPDLIRLVQGRKIPSGKRKQIIKEIDELWRRYQDVFGKTMLKASCEMEIQLRFSEARDIFKNTVS